jgi:hypothetical protein
MSIAHAFDLSTDATLDVDLFALVHLKLAIQISIAESRGKIP